MMWSRWLVMVVAVAWVGPGAGVGVGAEPTVGEARAALRKAVGFFRTRVAAEGGYLWRYKDDLTLREGEGEAGPATVWVQPPGTPAVGMALLDAHEASGEPGCLEGAVEAARALVRGQLESGLWNYAIHFDPAERAGWCYRVDRRHGRKARGNSVLDDDTSQAALRLLMRVDRALGFRDESIHEAARFALKALLGAQFDSGGFPQGFTGPVDAASSPPRKASLPEAWPREYPGHRDYWSMPTLNDNLLADVIGTLLEAAEVYGDDACRAAALKAGDFLLLAQLPDPQPGWAQQYGLDLRPIWARKFEPPAVTGSEAAGVIETLMDLYRRDGQAKWLEPIPRALAYYRGSRLPDGRLARFYELGTNRPLFFTRDYVLTHDDGDVPTHYAFKVEDWTGKLDARHRRLVAEPWAPPGPAAPPGRTPAASVARLIAALDGRGAWVEEGELRSHRLKTRVIDSATFARNVRLLARYGAPRTAPR